MTASDMVAPAPAPAPADAPAPEAPGAAGDVTPEQQKGNKGKVALLLIMVGLLAVLLGLAMWYLMFRQPVPLPPLPVTQVPHYVNTVYGLERPTGVAVSPAGDRIYVTQGGGDRVAVALDASGTKVAELLPPVSTGTDHAPVYIAVQPQTGEVYVTDRPTGSIYVYNAAGEYQRTFAAPEGRKDWQPLGIAFDKQANLYVTDVGNDPVVVAKIDPSGKVVATYGDKDNLNFPNGVAVDDAGRVYVTDSNNGRLLVYSADGVLLASNGRGADAGKLGLPRGIALDGQGRVYVMDTSGQTGFIYKAFTEGSKSLDYVGSFGAQGVQNGQFMYPNGIAVDAKGRIWVADTSNGRIQLWNY